MLSWASRAAAAAARPATQPPATGDVGIDGSKAAATTPLQATGQHLAPGGAAPATAQTPSVNGNLDDGGSGIADRRDDSADVDDGFTTVCRRGRFRGKDGAAGESSSPAKVDAERNSKEDDEDVDMLAMQWRMDDEGTEEDEAAQDAEAAAQRRPAHQVLWEELQEHRAELKSLRKQWPDGHWTIAYAQERMEIAEAAWRSEKPAPQASRALLRAEQAVRKSEGRADGLVEKIKALDAEYERKREGLEEALTEERHKLRDCRAALRKAQEEVGAEGRRAGDEGRTAAVGGDATDGTVVNAAVASLETEVAPELAALVEGLETSGVDDAIKQRAHALKAKLHLLHGGLQQYAQDSSHTGGQWHYDMAEDDSLPELTESERQGYHDGWYSQYPHQHGWYGNGEYWRSNGGDWHYQHYHYPPYQRGCGYPGVGSYTNGDERPNKRGKADATATTDSAMEEQSFEEMAVPTHLSADAAGGAQANAAEAAKATAAAAAANEAAEAATTALQAKIAEFKARAAERGVNVNDVEFATITSEQLDLLATTRLTAP